MGKHNRRPRRLTVQTSLAALSACLLTPACAFAGIPFLSGNGDVVIAPGARFIDGLGTVIPLPSSTDMTLRFGDGPRFSPRELVMLDDPRINGYARKAETIIDDLLRPYAKGPKPAHVPVFIVESDDPNCMVVPVNDGKEDKSEASTGLAAMFNQVKAKVTSKKDAGDDGDAGAAKNKPQPEQLEIHCTTAFFEHVAARDDSDDEVTFVLAHELGHVLLGHWERQEKLKHQSDEVAALVADGMLLSAVVNSKYTRSGNQIVMTPTAAVSKDVSKLFVADLAMQEFTTIVIGPHWQLLQERQADILGLDLLQEAGKARSGATKLLSGEKELEEQLRKSRPPFAERFLTSTAALAFVDFNQTGVTKAQAKHQFGTQFLINLYSQVRDMRITHVHDNADKRMATIAKYEDDHKVLTAQSSTGKAFFGSFTKDFAPIRADEELEKDMSTHDCDGLSPESLKTIDTLKHSKTRNQKENFDLANYYICKAQWNDAVVPARAGAAGKDKQPIYYLQYITVLQNTQAYSASLAVMDEATLKAPPPGQYVIPRIQSLVALKRQTDAETAAKACRDNQGIDMGRQCMAMVGLNLDGTPLPKDPVTLTGAVGAVLGKPDASAAPPPAPPPPPPPPAKKTVKKKHG